MNILPLNSNDNDDPNQESALIGEFFDGVIESTLDIESPIDQQIILERHNVPYPIAEFQECESDDESEKPIEKFIPDATVWQNVMISPYPQEVSIHRKCTFIINSKRFERQKSRNYSQK